MLVTFRLELQNIIPFPIWVNIVRGSIRERNPGLCSHRLSFYHHHECKSSSTVLTTTGMICTYFFGPIINDMKKETQLELTRLIRFWAINCLLNIASYVKQTFAWGCRNNTILFRCRAINSKFLLIQYTQPIHGRSHLGSSHLLPNFLYLTKWLTNNQVCSVVPYCIVRSGFAFFETGQDIADKVHPYVDHTAK